MKIGLSTIYYECEHPQNPKDVKRYAYTFKNKTYQQHKDREKILKQYLQKQQKSRYLGELFKVDDV